MTAILIAALATWHIIEIWHHSSLMSGPRSAVEVRTGMMAELLSCPFCLSPWVGLFCLSVLNVSPLLGIVGEAMTITLQALAVARLANVCNDLTHQFCRTPKILAGSYVSSLKGDSDDVDADISGQYSDPDLVEE